MFFVFMRLNSDAPLVVKLLLQVERLLRLIYRPQNVYCIHVDAKSSASVHRAIRAIASCFNNVILASEFIDIHWGEYSLLEAELICLRQLLNRPEPWRYYVNLMGREFPLRTNRELVQIFTAYNGANDVDGTLHRLETVVLLFCIYE
jgi:Core-2/I-Branching enzyme